MAKTPGLIARRPLTTTAAIMALSSRSSKLTRVAPIGGAPAEGGPSASGRRGRGLASRRPAYSEKTLSCKKDARSSSKLVDGRRHECLARLIGVDRERPLGSAAVAVGDLLEAEA